VVVLAAMWIALWERFSIANLLGGVAVGLALVLAFPPDRRGTYTVRPLPAARFLGYFAWKLLEASAIVAWEIVTPRNRINEGIVAIPISGVSEGLTTIVANAISLTPGTLTLEVVERPTVLYVHVLHLRDVDAVRTEVRYLEALAIRAFARAEPGGPGVDERPRSRPSPPAS
jgi:multicomponent Na+:H+ antiporter subunit E